MLVFVVAALMTVSGARIGERYSPSNADTFFHARRMLDVVTMVKPVDEFDASIQYPEGSWISWPPGFNTAIAAIIGVSGRSRSMDPSMETIADVRCERL